MYKEAPVDTVDNRVTECNSRVSHAKDARGMEYHSAHSLATLGSRGGIPMRTLHPM